MKPTPEQAQVCRYAGFLGHTHYALTRGADGALRIQSESCSLADALRVHPSESKPEAVMARFGKKRHLYRVA